MNYITWPLTPFFFFFLTLQTSTNVIPARASTECVAMWLGPSTVNVPMAASWTPPTPSVWVRHPTLYMETGTSPQGPEKAWLCVCDTDLQFSEIIWTSVEKYLLNIRLTVVVFSFCHFLFSSIFYNVNTATFIALHHPNKWANPSGYMLGWVSTPQPFQTSMKSF